MILCCFSNYRCAFTACIFEIVVSTVIWWHLVSAITHHFSSSIQVKDAFLFLIVTAWLVTLFTAFGNLYLAYKNRTYKNVLPRLVQLSGWLVIELLLVLVIAAYFSGCARSINNVILSIYETLMHDEPLKKEERSEAQSSLRYAFLILIMLNFFFICYTAFQLYVTKKFYNELEREAPPITTIVTSKENQKPLIQPTAPPLA